MFCFLKGTDQISAVRLMEKNGFLNVDRQNDVQVINLHLYSYRRKIYNLYISYILCAQLDLNFDRDNVVIFVCSKALSVLS